MEGSGTYSVRLSLRQPPPNGSDIHDFQRLREESLIAKPGPEGDGRARKEIYCLRRGETRPR